MSAALAVAIGAVLGAGFAWLAGLVGRERRVWAAGLVVAAVLYLVFAGAAGAGAEALAVELSGVVAFAAVAWLGLGRPLWLAAGWAVHVVWDVALHVQPGGYAPPLYPEACIGFDLAVAAFIAWRVRRPGSALPGTGG